MLDTLQKIVDNLYACIPRTKPELAKFQRCKIIAHRGVCNQPGVMENTFPAFDAALQAGVYGIEFDIRWTKDLQPVVFHDGDLRRLLNSPLKVNELNLAELQAQFPLIPTVEQVVTRYGKRLHLMVELKAEFYPDPSYQRERLSQQNEILSAIFTPLKPQQDFHFMTFVPSAIEQLPFIPKAAWLLIAEFNVNELFKRIVADKAGGLTGHYLLVTQQILIRCQQAGISVGTGQIDSKNTFYRELNRGIEWIFSNRADRLQAICNSELIRPIPPKFR